MLTSEDMAENADSARSLMPRWDAAKLLTSEAYHAAAQIPDRLPVLQRLVSERFAGQQPLRGVTAVLIQHQLGDIVAMAQALIDLGLSPKRIHWVDIPYTAHWQVAQRLRALGIPSAHFAPMRYRLGRPYATYQRRRVQDLIVQLQGELTADDRLLVLDDGAYFVEAAACFSKPPARLFVVEQTARGARRLREDATMRQYAARVPVVNVADSRPKKALETPFIGEAVCHALIAAVKSERDSVTRGPVLVLGFGAIGAAVARSLSTTAEIPPRQIYIVDPARGARDRARDRGFHVWNRSADEHPRFTLVVGCSGTTSLSVGDRAYLEDGAVLASASSGSAELARDHFIELADTHHGDDIHVVDRSTLRTRNVHTRIQLKLVDRHVTFLNGGFPINFDTRINDIPPRYIQPTKALMVGAAVEVLQAQRNGIARPSESLMRWIERRFVDTVLP
jgi:S-adenosylhomocysteine hydrolase